MTEDRQDARHFAERLVAIGRNLRPDQLVTIPQRNWDRVRQDLADATSYLVRVRAEEAEDQSAVSRTSPLFAMNRPESS